MDELIFKHENDAGDEVMQIVFFKYENGFDFVPYGEGDVECHYRSIEIFAIKYFIDFVEYTPTQSERKEWEYNLQHLINKQIDKAA